MASQNSPVTTADTKMPPAVTIAGWVTATVAIAFIGCTDIGVRK
jgi:hypothetical protein